MNWTHHRGGCEYWQAGGWFVQQLVNGLWICGQHPAEPGSWTAAELLYVSREDAMRACERRAEAAILTGTKGCSGHHGKTLQQMIDDMVSRAVKEKGLAKAQAIVDALPPEHQDLVWRNGIARNNEARKPVSRDASGETVHG